jgi:hypothetical protein
MQTHRSSGPSQSCFELMCSYILDPVWKPIRAQPSDYLIRQMATKVESRLPAHLLSCLVTLDVAWPPCLVPSESRCRMAGVEIPPGAEGSPGSASTRSSGKHTTARVQWSRSWMGTKMYCLRSRSMPLVHRRSRQKSGPSGCRFTRCTGGGGMQLSDGSRILRGQTTCGGSNVTSLQALSSINY